MSDAAPDSPYRERLIEAMADSIREQGYRGTTIAEIVARARTSRRTFYEHFAGREDCFLALFRRTNDAAIAAIVAAVDPQAAWTEQVDHALDRFVDTLLEDPRLNVSFARELPGLGVEAASAQRAAVEHFADLIVRLVNTDAMREAGVVPVDRHTALLLVGGLRELVVHAAEHAEDLGAIKPVARDVLKAVLDPERKRW
ncbi:TetR/AcrR family transcriptional regulator [Paraconexibacter sp.]|uniref:TetR/AcrR family transcriptional regulator n=1 Tax=Paraconexibacter sp. TaxID=2949640 RepID=UPI00356833AE